MIVGNKIVLREFREEDLNRMHNWVNNQSVTGLLAFAVLPRTLDDSKAFLRKQLQRENNTYINFVIAEKSSPDTYVGSVGLKNIDFINRKAELTLAIGYTEHQRKGFGSEATKLIVRYGFNTMNLNKIYLVCTKSNTAAIQTYQKNGFIIAGEMAEEMYINGSYQNLLYMELLKKNHIAQHDIIAQE